MQSVRASVSLRPKLYEWVKEQAESRQMSISRYIERCVEEKRGDEDDDGLEYSMEDLDASIKEAEEGLKNGTLPSFSSAEEMFVALNREINEATHKIHASVS